MNIYDTLIFFFQFFIKLLLLFTIIELNAYYSRTAVTFLALLEYQFSSFSYSSKPYTRRTCYDISILQLHGSVSTIIVSARTLFFNSLKQIHHISHVAKLNHWSSYISSGYDSPWSILKSFTQCSNQEAIRSLAGQEAYDKNKTSCKIIKYLFVF